MIRRWLLSTRWAVPVAVLALVLTAGTSYALFSSTLQFGNVSMTVGNAALEVRLPNGTVITQSSSAGYALTGLYPGLSQTHSFTLANTSTAPIALETSARLVSADGDWDVLKDVVIARVKDAGSSSSTGYKTLAQWNAEGGIKLPKTLAPGQSQDYTLDIQIDKAHGNEIAGKTLTNIKIDLTAIQDE